MEYKGSFIGFTFGNRHSSKLGILRTINDRYDESIVPETQDLLMNLSTMDGQYYWGTKYTKKDIPISFTFYGMTEEQLSKLKQTFNDKKIHPLILDEAPHKVWSAKLTGTSLIKHICFERDGARFYYGEGEFVFTTFDPYARSRYSYEEDYTPETIAEWGIDPMILTEFGKEEQIFPALLQYGTGPDQYGSIIGSEEGFLEWLQDVDLLIDKEVELNGINSIVDFFREDEYAINIEEWIAASGIPKRADGYGAYKDGSYKLYNPGDESMPFKIYFSVSSTPRVLDVECGLNKISLRDVTAQGNDKYIVLDSHSLTVQGCDENYKKTLNLYNNKITSGNLFKLPLGEIVLKSNVQADRLEFNYLYL